MDPLSQNNTAPVTLPQNDAPIVPPPESQQSQESPSSSASSVMGEVVAALQNSKNVLVTVRSNSSVDELASALGLTFLLGKLDKHTTAVFSGKIPPALDFLEPGKTFESTVDSLRDFIIALDKEKADKLRYKVEDDVVKVLITPYRTVISEKDLKFSQGDYNIDVVIALGVTQQEQLDKAIVSHGRILHDAIVVTVNAGTKTSTVGSIDWHEPEASSIAEMMVQLSDSLGAAEIDSQISTAFLTGVVAETNRFSNDKTTPKVMNIAAQLMAAGANQQLVATNLRQEGMISQQVRQKNSNQSPADDGEVVLDHSKNQQQNSQGNQNKQNKKKGAPNDQSESDTKLNSTTELNSNGVTKSTPNAQQSPSDSAAALTAALDKSVESAVSTDQSNSNEDSVLGAVQNTASKGEMKEHKVIEPLPPEPKESPREAAIQQPAVPQLPTLPQVGESTSEPADASQPLSFKSVAPASDNTKAEEGTAAVDDARRAVEQAADEQEPAATIAPPVSAPPTADSTGSSEVQPLQPPEDPAPMDAFMQSQDSPSQLTDSFKLDAAPQPAVPGPTVAPTTFTGGASESKIDDGLPPLPPLPSVGSAGLPPLPPPPVPGQVAGQSESMPPMQPQINPSFMQDMPQSSNAWTQAGAEISEKRADKEARRQERHENLSQEYNQAVEKNREIKEGVMPGTPGAPPPPLG